MSAFHFSTVSPFRPSHLLRSSAKVFSAIQTKKTFTIKHLFSFSFFNHFTFSSFSSSQFFSKKYFRLFKQQDLYRIIFQPFNFFNLFNPSAHSTFQAFIFPVFHQEIFSTISTEEFLKFFFLLFQQRSITTFSTFQFFQLFVLFTLQPLLFRFFIVKII